MAVETKGRPQIKRVKGTRFKQVFREVIGSHYDHVSKIAPFYYYSIQIQLGLFN
jgi:hypothetical protein